MNRQHYPYPLEEHYIRRMRETYRARAKHVAAIRTSDDLRRYRLRVRLAREGCAALFCDPTGQGERDLYRHVDTNGRLSRNSCGAHNIFGRRQGAVLALLAGRLTGDTRGDAVAFEPV